MTSAWRPMSVSVRHDCGLGLRPHGRDRQPTRASLRFQPKGQTKMKLSDSKHSDDRIELIATACHTEYGRRYPATVRSILAPRARAATLRLTPGEEET
jgi:hypothetical protein